MTTKIRDENDFIQAVAEIESRLQFIVFRSQLGLRPASDVEAIWSEISQKLHIIVGDSLEDLANHWNHPFTFETLGHERN